MGRLKNFVTSANGVPHQVMTRVMVGHKVNARKTARSPQVGKLLQCTATNVEPVVLLGKPRIVHESLLGLVKSHNRNQTLGTVVEHDRVWISGLVFHSEQ